MSKHKLVSMTVPFHNLRQTYLDSDISIDHFTRKVSDQSKPRNKPYKRRRHLINTYGEGVMLWRGLAGYEVKVLPLWGCKVA